MRVSFQDLAKFYGAHGWGYSAVEHVRSERDRGELLFASMQEGEIPVAVLRKAAVFGRPPILIGSGGEVFGESVIYPALSAQLPESNTLVTDFSRSLRPGRYLFLDGVYSEYFWHWVMEYLPRVVLARKIGFQGNVVVRKDAPSFVRESLALFGVEEVLERGDEVWTVDELVVAESITGTPGHGRTDITQYPSLIRALRTGLLRGARDDRESPGRIYVSRRNATRGRRIRNEPELIRMLSEFGFEELKLEELSLREQIQRTSRCQVLLGPHGAGMLHGLVMPECSVIIELCSPEFQPDTNFFTYQQFGHRYYSVVGDGHPEDDGIPPNLRDITVDLAQLRALLEQL